MPGLTVDGNDAVAIHNAMQDPLARARRGDGPTLIECSTYRQSGHHVNDPGLYMPKDQLEAWKLRDPVIVMREHVVAAGASADEISAIDTRVEKLIDEAVAFAQESPQPSREAFLQEVSAA